VDHPRSFFARKFDKDGPRISPEYESEVLSLGKGAVYASLNFLKDKMKAIDAADLESFDRVKHCRNRLSHSLLALLGSEGLPPDFEQCFHEMVALLHKIDAWWIINVEVPTNPDFDGQEIDESGVQSGRVMGIRLLCDIALGDSQTSRFYYDHFRKQSP
jgi:hypothetical protein